MWLLYCQYFVGALDTVSCWKADWCFSYKTYLRQSQASRVFLANSFLTKKLLKMKRAILAESHQGNKLVMNETQELMLCSIQIFCSNNWGYMQPFCLLEMFMTKGSEGVFCHGSWAGVVDFDSRGKEHYSVCWEPVFICYKDASWKLKVKLQEKLSLDCGTCYCSSELCSTLTTCFCLPCM